jgi:hypothetical protein
VARGERPARTRPHGGSLSRYHAIEVVRTLRKDRRFRVLAPIGREGLVWAVTERMNDRGAWWCTWRHWAEGTRCHPDALRKALAPAFQWTVNEDELVRCEPYFRAPYEGEDPDHWQGANNFYLDPKLLAEGIGTSTHGGVGQATQGGGSESPPKNELKGTSPVENESELLRSEKRFTLSDGEEQPSNYVETLMALRDLVAWLPDADENTFGTFVDHLAGVDACDIQDLHEFMVGRQLRAVQGKAEPFGNYSAYAFEALRRIVDGRYS